MIKHREYIKKAKYTFAVAEMHYFSATKLLNLDSNNIDDTSPSLLPSGYTLYCLALELYLKSLYFESGQTPPKRHDLVSLFDGLSKSSKELIEHGYETIFHESNWGKTTKARYPDIDFSLRGVLTAAKNGFETWRYIHEIALEDRHKSISFSLYEALPAVRALILTAYPSWCEFKNSDIIGEINRICIPAG